MFYVAAPSGPEHLPPFLAVLSELGVCHQTLVWVKDSFVLGRSDFHYRHELLLYGWKKGRHRRPPERCHDTVWDIPRQRANPEHPTAKPLGLVERSVTLSSRRGRRRPRSLPRLGHDPDRMRAPRAALIWDRARPPLRRRRHRPLRGPHRGPDPAGRATGKGGMTWHERGRSPF